MRHIDLHGEFLDSTRGRVVAAIRAGKSTVDEIAAELGVTGNAVRAQLASLQRDGLIRAGAMRRGSTRPAQTYELTPELEHLLSRAYIPLLTHLVRLFAANEPAAKFNAVMRRAGRDFARELAPKSLGDSLAARVQAASQILNRELGASTRVERNGSYVIRGTSCPLAALTGKHRGACLAIESLVGEIVQSPVKECCDRNERPRCCFEISRERSR